MIPLDSDIGGSRALVVDGNPTSRSILCGQLQDLGVGQVVQAARLADARKHLEERHFDIIVCEQNFPGVEQSGQDLLDELQRDGLLPWATVFIMVTGEARYEHVAEAAESALDGYLLKPYAAATLAERLRVARRRKRSFKTVFEAVEAGQLEGAAGLCLQRFQERGELWTYAARIGGELLSRLKRYDTALQLYRVLDTACPATWVTLGIARVLSETGQNDQAAQTLKSLLEAEPECADAHEALGHLQIGEGSMEDALASYRHAAALTPGSIPRLQRQGVLAYYLGHAAEAQRALDRATSLGLSSKMFDQLSWLLLAFLRHRARDTRGLQRCRSALERAAGAAPDSRRLARFAAFARVLERHAQGHVDEALAKALALVDERTAPDFDVEAACMLLGLWSELAASGSDDAGMTHGVDDLVQRFSLSRSVEELMTLACARHPAFAERVRAGHVALQSAMQEAMASVLSGQPGAAVSALLALGARTGNARVIANAHQVLQRHRAQIDDAEALQCRLDALRERYDNAAAAPMLGGGIRVPGSIQLRGSAARRAGTAAAPTVRTASPDQPAARAV